MYALYESVISYCKRHNAHGLNNETVNHVNLVLLSICLTNNALKGNDLFGRKHFPENGIISYNGVFHLMAMLLCDIIVLKETGRLLLTKTIETCETLSVRIMLDQI